MKKNLSIFFLFLFFVVCLFGQKDISLSSPDGRIVFTFKINEGLPAYSIVFKKNLVIENSYLNLELDGMGLFRQAFIDQPAAFKTVNESYKLIVGKTSNAKN